MGGWGSQNVLPPSLLGIGWPETDFLCAARNPTAFSSPSSAVTSFPRSQSGTELILFASLQFFFCFCFAECSMWEDNAQSERSGSTVLRESQPLSSAWRWALMTWSWLRTRRWWEKKTHTHSATPVSLVHLPPQQTAAGFILYISSVAHFHGWVVLVESANCCTFPLYFWPSAVRL